MEEDIDMRKHVVYSSRLHYSILLCLLVVGRAVAAPDAELWPRWEAHDPDSRVTVDHTPFATFIERYLIERDGVHFIRYGAVSEEDRNDLERYVDSLQRVSVSELSRPEQMAYWINLYNAYTIKLILDHYPVDSIRDIKLGGLFASGPWDAKLMEIEGEEVSLNDVEHRILRPIWRDLRIHYAVNCASYSCPNLQPVPFTAGNTEELLDRGAREYVNHPRGVRFEGRRLYVSSIYAWYQEDFGGTEAGVIEHLLGYAEEPLAERLREYDGSLRDEYDWSLNEP